MKERNREKIALQKSLKVRRADVSLLEKGLAAIESAEMLSEISTKVYKAVLDEIQSVRPIVPVDAILDKFPELTMAIGLKCNFMTQARTYRGTKKYHRVITFDETCQSVVVEIKGLFFRAGYFPTEGGTTCFVPYELERISPQKFMELIPKKKIIKYVDGGLLGVIEKGLKLWDSMINPVSSREQAIKIMADRVPA